MGRAEDAQGMRATLLPEPLEPPCTGTQHLVPPTAYRLGAPGCPTRVASSPTAVAADKTFTPSIESVSSFTGTLRRTPLTLGSSSTRSSLRAGALRSTSSATPRGVAYDYLSSAENAVKVANYAHRLDADGWARWTQWRSRRSTCGLKGIWPSTRRAISRGDKPGRLTQTTGRHQRDLRGALQPL